MKDLAHMFLDIHAIQTVPPSNINRDDAGSPKTAQYGGAIRARVSSQSWKRAIRTYFRKHSSEWELDEAMPGIRSLRLPEHIATKASEKNSQVSTEEIWKKVKEIFSSVGLKKEKGKKGSEEYKTDALCFLSQKQVDNLVEIVSKSVSESLSSDDMKKLVMQALSSNYSADIALFGRMIASNQSLNVDASAQVAHAISTHQIQTEFDYYTGVDDLSPKENSGAGMIGSIEYDSATLYRYANVAVHELLSQLGSKNVEAGDGGSVNREDRSTAIKVIQLFIEAFIKSMPSGKINSFANQTLPQFVLLTLRSDRPINLVSAFENPIKSREGYVSESIKRLTEEHERAQKFVNKPLATFYVGFDALDGAREVGASQENLQDLLNAVGKKIEESF